MRTSNKIILSLILTAVLLFAGLFLTVRIKYANGAIVKRDVTAEPLSAWADVHPIAGPIRSVLIRGLNDVVIVPAGAPRVEIAKEMKNAITWKFENGVLTVMADSVIKEDGKRLVRGGHVELFLPHTDSITIEDCTAYLKNTADTALASFKLNISQSVFHVLADKRQSNNGPTRYGTLQLNARSSAIMLGGGIFINELDVNLASSQLEETEEGANYSNKPRITLDGPSVLRVSGKNLSKAIITSKE